MGYEPIWKFEGNKFVGIVWVKSTEIQARESQERDNNQPIKKAS